MGLFNRIWNRGAGLERDGAGNYYIFPGRGSATSCLHGLHFGKGGLVSVALSVPEVYFPVDAIAERASSLPFRLRFKGEAVDEARYPFGFKRLFERPNLYQGFNQMVYDLVFYRAVTGTTWVYTNRADRGLKGLINVSSISVLNPDAATPVYRAGYRGGLIGVHSYSDVVAGFKDEATGEVLPVEDVTVSVERPDAESGGVRGSSPLWPVRASVELLASVYAARYNVYNNNGVAGVMCKEGDEGGFDTSVDPRAREAIADELSQRYNIASLGGSIKALSTVPLKFIKTLATISELEPFKECDRDALAVAAAYQVPKHLVPNEIGVTYDNARESEKAFWTNVVIPAARTAGKLLGDAMYLPGGYTIEPDASGVPVLQEDRLASLQADKQEIDNLAALAAGFPALAARAGEAANNIMIRYEQNTVS